MALRDRFYPAGSVLRYRLIKDAAVEITYLTKEDDSALCLTETGAKVWVNRNILEEV